MNWEILFQLSNLIILPFWILMIFAPNFKWTQKIMQSLWVIAPIAFLYLGLILSLTFGDFGPALTLSNPPQVTDITVGLSTAAGATVAWAHFLAFDLFVGRWVYLDSRKRDRNPIWMGVVLLFVFMLGPIGFLLYLADQTIPKE